jgi:hypothetical protein
MAKAVLPRVNALLMCDDIEPSPGEAGVYNLIGVRTRLHASAFPYVHPRLYVYLQLTGHEGEFSGTLIVVSARTDEEAFTRPIPPVELKGPLYVVRVALRVQDCEFPEPGVYYVQAYYGQKLVFERPLHVLESQVLPNGQEPA